MHPSCLRHAVQLDLNLHSIRFGVCRSLLPPSIHGRVLHTRLRCLTRQNVSAAHISSYLFLARLTLFPPPNHFLVWNRQSASSSNSGLATAAHIAPRPNL